MSNETADNSKNEVNKLEKKYGIVVFLDAVGTRKKNIEGCETFLKTRNDLIDSLETNRGKFQKHIQENSDDYYKNTKGKHRNLRCVSDTVRKSLGNLATYKVGDSIIITWEVNKGEPDVSYLSLLAAAEYLAPLFYYALEGHLLLRGAISMGDFFVNKDINETPLGPAVADAVEWEHRADWFGIITTPSCGWKAGRAALKAGGIKEYGHLFINYEVPIKGEGRKKVWAITWPYEYYSRKYNPGNRYDLKKFYELMDAHNPIPDGAEDKYANTLDFMHFCLYKVIERKIYPPPKDKK